MWRPLAGVIAREGRLFQAARSLGRRAWLLRDRASPHHRDVAVRGASGVQYLWRVEACAVLAIVARHFADIGEDLRRARRQALLPRRFDLAWAVPGLGDFLAFRRGRH